MSNNKTRRIVVEPPKQADIQIPPPIKNQQHNKNKILYEIAAKIRENSSLILEL